MFTKIKLVTFVLFASAFLIAGCGTKKEVKNTVNNNSKNESLAPVSQNTTNTIQSSGNKNGVKPIHLTAAAFKEKVFNYDKNKDWKYEGDRPCIVDFYADWCKPCKMVAPILEELSTEFEGKLIIYKVNTDEEQELAGVFGIQSIPSLLFVPATGQPKMMTGAMPKDSFIKNINEYLIKN